MSNKVLVTGLSLGKKFDTCQACGLDMNWLLRYPSILVWADKIFIPESIWSDATTEHIFDSDKYSDINKCIKLIFEFARAEGIIEIVNPQSVIDSSISGKISEQIEKDRIQLSKLFPESIHVGDDEKVPGQLFINGTEYCHPFMWIVYASLVLSKAWDAHCLFDNRTMNICGYKFGLSNLPPHADLGRIEALQSIFEGYLPNETIFPEYITTKRAECGNCTREQKCKDTYLSTLESNLKKTLSMRAYDEISQLKSVINDIVDKRNKSGGIIDASEIRQEFLDTQNKLRRRIRLVFPKIKRWSNITTVLSIPIALAGAATGLPLLTITGSSLFGLSQAASKTTDILSSKYSWTGFISKDVSFHQ